MPKSAVLPSSVHLMQSGSMLYEVCMCCSTPACQADVNQREKLTNIQCMRDAQLEGNASVCYQAACDTHTHSRV
jgi:hypothetical protein